MLAQVEDVKRALRIADVNASRDEALRKFLETAHDYYFDRKGRSYDLAEARTDTFFDVHEDAEVELLTNTSAVTELRVFAEVGSTAWVLPANSYDLQDHRYVRLRPDLWVTPFEGAWARRLVNTFHRIEVDYTPNGTVPATVRDGIAMLAAAMWYQAPLLAKGLTSESLGDYSYSLASASGGEYYGAAMKLLQPHLARKVQVT